MKKAMVVLYVLMVTVAGAFSQHREFLKRTDTYLGFEPPGMIPEIFAPGLVSTATGHEVYLTVYPGEQEIYYCILTPKGNELTSTIVFRKYENGAWTDLQVAPFSGTYCDGYIAIHPNGSRLYFQSDRPIDPSESQHTWNIWYVEREGDSWGIPHSIGKPINGTNDVSGPSVTMNGTMYFTLMTSGGRINKIYRSECIGGIYQQPEILPYIVNSANQQFDSYISPDERYLIFGSYQRPDTYGSTDLYVSFRDENGNWIKTLNFGPLFNTSVAEGSATITTDGKYIFTNAYNPANGKLDIYWVDAKIVEDILHPAYEGQIAYCYQPMQGGLHQIYRINSDGSDNKKMINAQIGLNHHDWSPDGQKLAAVGYVNQTTWSIYTFHADGTGLARLTTTANVFDSEPSWSPDGSKIAFTRIYPNQNYRNEIWIMNADGSDQHYIGVEGFAARWSPDGTKFIFTSTGDWGPPGFKGSDIKTCDINGTNVQQITHTAGDEWYPSWSPDGKRILFGYSSAGNYASNEIFIMNSDTTGRQRLTTNNCYDGSPRWSPDGSKICYSSDLSAYQHWEVYVMNDDGSNINRVTNTPSNATAINPVWRPITDPTSVKDSGQSFNSSPKNFQLFQNYPNPFNSRTTIGYHLSHPAKMRIQIFDMMGRLVYTLIDHQQQAGDYQLSWAGTDRNGLPVSTGIYLCQLSADRQKVTNKMILIK